MRRQGTTRPSKRRPVFGAAAAALMVGFLGACDGLLDVELPGQITEEALDDPGQATVLVNSAIADIECSVSEFVASNAAGFEDVAIRVTGWWGGSLEYESDPDLTECNEGTTLYGWWTPLQKGRFEAEDAYQRISDWDEADIVGDKRELLATSAIYTGYAYSQLGEHFCEVAVDGGPLMSPDATLAEAENWLTTALDAHIAGEDFKVTAGIAESARQMALLLRSRVRFARGDYTGALADAEQIGIGFTAVATRDAGGVRERWNRVVDALNGEGWGTIIGPVDWWEGPPNPATGEPWPEVIPFTGYRNLGILPDGRAISTDQYPITTTENATAVVDTRVPVVEAGEFNNFPAWKQQKYTGLDSPIPMANWEEAWLIRAEIENEVNNDQGAAVALVNEIRGEHDLPLVTYNPSTQAEVRDLIIEERRRSLFLEGRFWSTKIREDLWFPRGVGLTPYPYVYMSGVRMAMDPSEYELNQNFTLAERGTLCAADERPL